MRTLLIGLAVLIASTAFSQSVLDGVYVKEHIPTKKLIQYTHLREADVMWEKRIWRVIDLREKINFPLYYPLKPLTDRMSLFDVMRFWMLKGELTVYQALNLNAKDLNEADFGADQFLFPLNQSSPTYMQEVQNLMLNDVNQSTTAYQVSDGMGGLMDSLDAAGNPVYPPADTVWVESKDIIAWEIKEDWFFDKQRSVMDVRIIGIAPLTYAMDPATKTITGTRTLFWLYFPELRYILQNHFVYNRLNDAQRMSFDDLFWKRMFTSYIKKESNIYDRRIVDYTAGVDALLESEKIKETMQDFEHDVWDL